MYEFAGLVVEFDGCKKPLKSIKQEGNAICFCVIAYSVEARIKAGITGRQLQKFK